MTETSGASFELAPSELGERLRRGHAQVIDLRGASERAQGRIAGSRAIGIDDLPREAMTLDRDRPVVFCGDRSAEAAGILREHGYTAYALTGGVNAWREGGLPVADE